MPELSKIRPDRDDLVEQLELDLQGQDSWKDRVVSSTGRTLIDFVAAIGAYSQYSIESAYQESWPESAKNKDSLYAASTFAGVRFNRKLPARVTVSLSRAAGNIIVPAFSQFIINGTQWFNRDALSVTASPQNFTLYQGKIVSVSLTGIGTPFQAYVTPETDFSVSDIDMVVRINAQVIQTSTRGLWAFPATPAAQQFTLPNGACILLFGNSKYGSVPGVNDTVEITYAVTFGLDGNNLSVQNQKCYLESDLTVTGTATSAPSEAANETDAFVYKNVTPALFGSFDSACTPAQYKALPLQFPGVIDAQVYAQRLVNPKALTWMNNMKVVLLTAAPFSAPTWASFVAFMQRRSQYKCQFIRKDPVAVPINIDVDVYCSNFSNLSEIKTKVELALTALLTPRLGTLGLDIYRSDIERTIDAADQNVEYMVVRQPTNDVILSSLNVNEPTLTELGGGSLPAGVYDYAISVVSIFGGETAPANWGSIEVTGSGNSVKIDWAAVANAANYKIWGRITGNALGLIATVSGSTFTYTDTGGITPSGSVPVEATIDSYYPSLGTLNVKAYYSTRSIRIDEDH